MNYDFGLPGVHRSGLITLKPFEEVYALSNKEHCTKVDRSARFQKSVTTEHWIENIDFLLNTIEKYGQTHKNCDEYFKLKL